MCHGIMAGVPYGEDIGKIDQAQTAPSGTQHVFNKGTQVVAQSKSESGGNSAVVWLQLQEI